MAKTRNTEVEEVVTPEVDQVVEEKDAVTVAWRLGTRTYTKAEHGADFKKLAKEFADKKGGKLV